MSRSYKKNPALGHVYYFSNKKDRTRANGTMRAKNKLKMHLIIEGIDPDDIGFISLREASDTYDFSSDGLPVYHTYEKDVVNNFHRILKKRRWIGNQRRKSLRKFERTQKFVDNYMWYKK